MPDDELAPDREEILEMLGETIQDVHTRLEEYPDSETADERLQIKWTRTLGYLVGKYRKLQAEMDLDEMQADIKLLELAIGHDEEDR